MKFTYQFHDVKQKIKQAVTRFESKKCQSRCSLNLRLAGGIKMASYHFRIKSDKKSNGERVSASVHVDYISRQGKYKNEGTNKNFETNFIAFADTKNLGEETFPLYLTDDFGKIFYTPKGLQVSGKYSPTTLSIALTLAKNISNNQPLILQGSQKFKKASFKAAVDSEMDIKFADENLQCSFFVTKARKKFEERKFVERGGKIITTRSIQKSNFKKFNRRTISDAADAGFNMQVLSAKSVANAKSATATSVFLSSDELDKLVARGRKNNPAVRWNFSSEQRNLAE